MFVQIIKGQVADREELRESTERWVRDLSPGAIGWLGTTAGVTADGVGFCVARFESQEAARRNSNRPEQGQWWVETAKCFAGEVSFRDTTEVTTMGDGGSDAAGFVQIIEGRCTDVPRAKQLMDKLAPALGRDRPEVLGGLVCGFDGGDFTQVVYFTSETAARAGEATEPPADVREVMQEQMALMVDMKFYDLTDPWLESAR